MAPKKMTLKLVIPFVIDWFGKKELCIMRLVAKKFTLNGVRYLNESFQMSKKIVKRICGKLPSFVTEQLLSFPNNIKMCFYPYYRTIEFLSIWQELIHTPYFDNIHTIDFSGCSYISKLHILEPILERVHILRLYHSNITSIDAFNKIDKGNCRLQVLDLSHNPIKDISPLALIKLKRLDLKSTLVSDISMLSDIEELDISDTKVIDVSLLGKTKTLDITGTKVKDIAGLLSVTTLFIASVQITNFPLLPELKRLEMDYETFYKLAKINSPYVIDAYFFEKASSLFQNGLEKVYINGGHICFCFSDKSKLKVFCFSGGLMDTLHHSSLPFINELQSLDLSYSEISDISTLETLTNLTHLNLAQTNISNINVLRNLTNLTYLDISITEVPSFELLQFLTNLEELDLKSTNFNDLSHLTNLHNLEKLYLSDTKIKDISLLPTFPKLKIVTLHETSVPKEDIEYHNKNNNIIIYY
jgi:Leucine-rich repeat (LRR) protein